MKQPVFYLRDERVRDNLIDYIRKLPVNDALPLVVKFSEADRTSRPKRPLPRSLWRYSEAIAMGWQVARPRFMESPVCLRPCHCHR